MSNKSKNKKYTVPKRTARQYKTDIAFVSSVVGIFTLAALCLIILPRTNYSETERRELTKYPEFTMEEYFSGEYAETVSKWFSDTVPQRDAIMEISAAIQKIKGFKQNNIELHGVGGLDKVDDDNSDVSAPDTSKPTESTPVESQPVTSEPIENTEKTSSDTSLDTSNEEIKDPGINNNDPAGNIEINNANGVAVVGTRALMMYGSNPGMQVNYANVLNKFKAALPDVNVYCMLVPTACEFYSPPELDGYHSSQLKAINNVSSNLVNVKNIDVYTPLANHVSEDIYLRTDHHWAPLGAYYAAEAFAKAAGVPFYDLSHYNRVVNKNFCGSMYGYSNYNVTLKNNPEDFVYYKPKDIEYTATYYNYMLDENWDVVGAYDPYDASFFIDYGDNGGNNYCTFMGGDAKIVHVKTNAGTGRKLAIFKDSYGNAVPGYLFGSFDDIYVLDLRYFTYNGVSFMKKHGITDLLFANNIFTAGDSGKINSYEEILVQNDNDMFKMYYEEFEITNN